MQFSSSLTFNVLLIIQYILQNRIRTKSLQVKENRTYNRYNVIFVCFEKQKKFSVPVFDKQKLDVNNLFNSNTTKKSF